MCGVCCCSMKTVVYLDLIACMILPASTVYAAYLIFLVAAGKTKFSVLLLVLYGLIIGVPVFYFVLPLYAFWHMDDFSWGETRKVAAMQKSFNNPPPAVEKEEDDYSTGSDRSGSGSGYDDEDYSRDEEDDDKEDYDDNYDYNRRDSRGSRR